MNPLLQAFETPFETPPFNQISEEHFLPALKQGIAEAKEEIEAISGSADPASFSNTIEALEASGDSVGRTAEIFFNLLSAETNGTLQKISRDFSPLLTEYSNDIMLNEKLFERIHAVYENREAENLSGEQAMLLHKTYRSFVRNGALLKGKDRERLREIDRELAGLSLHFGENVLGETNAFELVLDEKDLDGLPESVKEAAEETAREKGMEGKWIFNLQYPSYVPFITYSARRDLREKMVKAFGSRAFHSEERDNREIVLKIAHLRFERAQLLGFENHAEYILQERMAEAPEKVKHFLNDLLKAARPAGQKEVEELTQYANEQDGIKELMKWDLSFYSEKFKQQRFGIDDETLKPYFKLEDVIRGAFEVANKLYGISFSERNDIQKYHPDVTTYEVLDEKGNHQAVFYADFFPRQGKRNGAWMTSYRSQKKVNGVDIRPHISIVCNFSKPTRTKPSLLTFNEVLTLFHEFGHALHGMLANGNYASLSGTNVYWDFVELPSQVMENWCYQKECLDIFAYHYQTGQPIPATMVEKLRQSSSFMEGYATVRQIGLATLDMAWHATDPREIDDVGIYEQTVLAGTELLPWIDASNTSCSFSHIFQGGYSAGYYSYKWAEVLDADAFEYFQEKGIFNEEVAGKFKGLLSAGGTRHPKELYKEFRGKEPDPKALLRRAGLLKL
ncbi:MAG: M3 family metallopeptidase [Owenweeksia sp.]